MGIKTQAMRLVPGVGDEPASGNAYLGLRSGSGVVGWGATLVVTLLFPPEKILQASRYVMAVWLLGVGFTVLSVRTSFDDAVRNNIPEYVWTLGAVLALGANAYAYLSLEGVVSLSADLVVPLFWMPWAGAFALGYLVTGLQVTRGGVYLLAAGLSAALFSVGFFETFAARPDLAPVVVLALGVLHIVPPLVDGYRGGRDVDETGAPRVAKEETGAKRMTT